MRFLLGRTDVLGDLIASLPVMARILSRDPRADIHWLVKPYTAPVLQGLPGVGGIHLREEGQDLVALMRDLRPDAVLTLSHRDRAITVAAARAGVPVRVARPRGLDQFRAATHRLWKSRFGSGRHESENALDFLFPWGWSGGIPEPPRLQVSEGELAEARQALGPRTRPLLGLILRGSGAGAFPGEAWWARTRPLLHEAGWDTVVLGPEAASDLPPAPLRGFLARLAACDAVLGPSTGPLHCAAALDRPVLCLMGHRPNHTPDRWAPLGRRVQVLQYPGPEADLSGGMDRLDPAALLPHLERLR